MTHNRLVTSLKPSMSIFSWFSRGKKPVLPVASDVQTGMSGMESTRPLMPNAQRSSSVPKSPSDRHAQRRNERNARRELLYQVVRESMVRAGVLSSGYKFKVLSLDQRGKEFMVMIDLAAEFAGEMEKLAEIETMVARSAKIRHDVQVQALYWRFNTLPDGGVAVTPPQAHESARPSFSTSSWSMPRHKPSTSTAWMRNSAHEFASACNTSAEIFSSVNFCQRSVTTK